VFFHAGWREAAFLKRKSNAMKFVPTLLVAGLAAMLSSFASAQGAQAPADAGQRIATQVCAACHGADGNSASPAYPSIAAQPSDYITVQLAHFKAGIRVNPIMQPIASTLSDADMRALGAYFAKQQAKPSASKDPALVKTGQALYRGGSSAAGIPACAACHSPDGAGIPKNFPRLAGQSADYTYAQLKAFKAGERGNDTAGKDVNGRIMYTIAQNLSDVQMRAVADYVAGLR
jgi:cytochrome c553